MSHACPFFSPEFKKQAYDTYADLRLDISVENLEWRPIQALRSLKSLPVAWN